MRAFKITIFAIFILQYRASALLPDDNDDDPTEAKYYSESKHSVHLDGRFSSPSSFSMSRTERHDHLIALAHSYITTMADLRVTTWLGHGTLLGWYWGQQILPWDFDLDVHITFPDLRFLAAYYNMTVHSHGFEYLLDINPHYLQRESREDGSNKIDARWVDMTTGLFVDITAVEETHSQLSHEEQLLKAKDGHVFDRDAVFPLQPSMFEGKETFVPRDPGKILVGEYGADALTRDVYRGFKYDKDQSKWNAVKSGPCWIDDDPPRAC